MRGLKILFSVLFWASLLLGATTVHAANEPYIVKPGDSLSSIARRYDVSVTQLAATNGLRWNAWLYAGQRLTIPGQASAAAPASTSEAAEDGTYTVQPGDTLTSIAVRHGVRVDDLALANNLTGSRLIYAGQRLVIPGQETGSASEPTPESMAAANGVYIVRPGNTLFSIARWNGTTVAALMAANGLHSTTIYSGQRLTIPNGHSTPSAPPAQVADYGEKWIDVNLTTQTVTAFQGQTPVYSVRASTGLWGTPTVVGTYHIYAKYLATPMSGPGYYLPNVPHTMYFYRGYAIHGAYWHNNFGTPMSHGCVNLSLPDAAWFYNWAPLGTKVVSHY